MAVLPATSQFIFFRPAATLDLDRRENMRGAPNTNRTHNPPQPLTAGDYVWISAFAGCVGIGLLVLFVFLIPRLLPANLLNQFFYIVLVVWGLISALVLFGAMRSYATVTHRSAGGAIEIGGPAAIAFLVVVGGFWLVPRTDTFDLTVRPRGPDAPLVTTGRIRIELGNSSRSEQVHENGEADFKGIPLKYRGTALRILPQVDRYKQEPQTIVIDKDAVDLHLELAPPPQTILKGRIVPTPRKEQVVKVLVQGEHGEAVPDEYGRFQFIVHKNSQDRVRVNVCADGQRIYDDYLTLVTDEVEIPTRRPDITCAH